MKPQGITRTISRPIIRKRQLTVEELKTTPIPIQIQDDRVILEYSLKGWKIQQPVTLSLEKVLAVKENGLITYILSAFLSERPNLIPFVFENQTVIKMARHFLRHCSGSIWLGYSPDLIIQDTKPVGNIPDPQRVQNHQGYLDNYIAELQDEGLSPRRVHCYPNTSKPSTASTASKSNSPNP